MGKITTAIGNFFKHKHYTGDLSVLSKDVLIRTTEDGLFEIWQCICKCKCGVKVSKKFAFGTDKFYNFRVLGPTNFITSEEVNNAFK